MKPTPEDRQAGWKRKYNVTHADGTPCDPEAMYFVLRLDYHEGCDTRHIEACRRAARTYAAHATDNLPALSRDLIEYLDDSSPSGICPVHIQSAINAELDRLRETCRVERGILRGQKSVHPENWGGSPETSRKTRDEEIPKTEARLAEADAALALFVRDSKPLMPADWMPNDHGRLCWDGFLGGRPINDHYCDLPEGHDGPHSDADGCWPNKGAAVNER